ncbi:MAG: DUF58 domain-containing protein [Planctomycetota bacterium]
MTPAVRPAPTLNGWLAILLLVASSLLPFLVELPRLWWLVGVLAVLLITDLLPSWWARPALRTSWLLPRQAHAGSEVAIGLRLQGGQPRRPGLLWSWLPEADRHLPMSILPPAPAGHSTRCAWRVRFPERGRYHMPGPLLRQEGTLGLFQRWHALARPADLVILPSLGSMRNSFRQRLERFMQEGRSSPHQGEEDIIRLRPYRPGDAPRDVQWKASARARSLLVGVRGLPTTRHLALLLDLRSTNAVSQRLERLICIAATIVDHCLARGWVITLHGGKAGEQGIGGDRLQLMRTLALLETDTRPASPEPEPPGGPCLALGLYPSDQLRASPSVLAFDLDQAEEFVHLPRLPRRRLP